MTGNTILRKAVLPSMLRPPWCHPKDTKETRSPMDN